MLETIPVSSGGRNGCDEQDRIWIRFWENFILLPYSTHVLGNIREESPDPTRCQTPGLHTHTHMQARLVHLIPSNARETRIMTNRGGFAKARIWNGGDLDCASKWLIPPRRSRGSWKKAVMLNGTEVSSKRPELGGGRARVGGVAGCWRFKLPERCPAEFILEVCFEFTALPL